MKIIQVGLLAADSAWLQPMLRDPRIRLIGCVDPDSSALDRTHARSPDRGVACYSRLEDALTATDADVAVVASPIAERASHAALALEAGLTVLAESPFAANLLEAARVLDTSRRTGRQLLVTGRHRFERSERRIRELVREGAIGAVTHVSCMDARAGRAGGPDAEPSSHAQVFHAAAAHFESLRNILGVRPVSVMARSTRAPWSEYRHGSTTEAAVEMEAGIYVQYRGSLTSSRNEHALWIDGEKGTVWSDRAHVWWRKRGWPVFLPLAVSGLKTTSGGPRDAVAALIAELEAPTLGRRSSETSADDGVWTVAMVEAAVLSDTTNAVVRVGELLARAGLVRDPSAENLQGVG